MPYIVPSNVAVQVENPPDEWLNGLSVYSTSEGADEMLDLYRRLVNSNDYYWMGVPVPTGTNINIPGYQGYEAGVSVPPGSYIISLTGSSSDPAGFKFSLSDKGSKLQLTEKTFIQSNLILGNEFPVSGGLVEDNPSQAGQQVSADGLPANHIPLDASASVAMPAVGVEKDVVSYQVQNGYDAIIKLYSCNYLAGGFVEGSGDIIWRIKIDGRPVKNFDSITTQRGSLQIPRQIYNLRVYSGQTLSLTVTCNNITLTGNTEGSFLGYTYPSQGN